MAAWWVTLVDRWARLERRILVNVEPRETRLAVLEDGKLVELRTEAEQQEVGSIYKGRIERVLPGMDSCFVDIGLDRNAFMHAKDFAEADEIASANAEAQPQKGGRQRRPGPPRGRWRERDLPPITAVAQEGQSILVQVARGTLGRKGARATTRISLPGRYVVLLPVGAAHAGVSRRIESDAERSRLKELANRVKPRGYGLIVRTEGEGCTFEDMEADVEQLKRDWRRIKDAFRRKHAASLLQEELSLVERMIRDRYSEETREILIDSSEEHEKASRALRAISKEAAARCTHYTGRVPLFEAYGIENEIVRLLKRRVDLPSGGNLTIDENEAMCTVDVNTGRFTGTKNLEDTVVTTNIEAAHEIARQLRVRDIGGIIILDFIDMLESANRKQVVQVLEEQLAKDRARTRIVHLSPLGLVEMTRKRTGLSLSQELLRTCPHCRGQGRVLSPEGLAARVERTLRRRAAESKPEAFAVVVPPEVAWEMLGEDGRDIASFEEFLGAEVYLRCDPLYSQDQFDIRQGKSAAIATEFHPFRTGQMFHCRPRPMTFGEDRETLCAEVEGYLILVEDMQGEPDGLVTVELKEVQRSVARGRIVG
jgi:ribonuclease G